MKWCFSHITENHAAVVSCHGYFEIQQANSYNSYAASAVGDRPVYHRNDDGTRTLLPSPVVIAEGDVDELGLHYDPYRDDLVEHDEETIRAAVLRYIVANGL